MVETVKKIEISLVPSWVLWLFLAYILGYFQYGRTLDGGLATVLMVIACSVLALIGLLPIIDVILYFYIGETWLIPNVLTFVDIQPSWLTHTIFIIGAIFAIILTLCSTILLITLITEK